MNEYKRWSQWIAEHPEVLDYWGDCDECEAECVACIHYLLWLEEYEDEFLARVKEFVELTVEELYLHPNWSQSEIDEYGPEMGYLVEVYFRNKLYEKEGE